MKPCVNQIAKKSGISKAGRLYYGSRFRTLSRRRGWKGGGGVGYLTKRGEGSDRENVKGVINVKLSLLQ